MKGGKPNGYTILEVMIVLAISGVMFILAASFISGRQAKAAYETGITDASSAILTNLSQVQDGEYSDVGVKCAVSVTGDLSFYTGGAQGQQGDCLYLGKIMQFGAENETQQYKVYTIAGRTTIGGKNVTSLTQASPTPIYSSAINLIKTSSFGSGIEVEGVDVSPLNTPAAKKKVYAFGFLQSIPTSLVEDAATGNNKPIELRYIDSITSPDTQANALVEMSKTTNYKLAAKVVVCVTDGNNRHAQIVIGTNNNKLAVTLDRSVTANECTP